MIIFFPVARLLDSHKDMILLRFTSIKYPLRFASPVRIYNSWVFASLFFFFLRRVFFIVFYFFIFSQIYSLFLQWIPVLFFLFLTLTEIVYIRFFSWYIAQILSNSFVFKRKHNLHRVRFQSHLGHLDWPQVRIRYKYWFHLVFDDLLFLFYFSPHCLIIFFYIEGLSSESESDFERGARRRRKYVNTYLFIAFFN